MDLSFSTNDTYILIGAVVFLAPQVCMSIIATTKAEDLSPSERSQRIIMIALGEAGLLALTVVGLLITSF